MPAAESHSGGILRNRFSLATSASGWQGFASGAVRTSPRIGPETLRDRHRRAPRRCTYSRSRAAQHRIDRLALVGRAAAAFISGNKRRDGWSATTSSARKKKQTSIATLQRHLPRADRRRDQALARGGGLCRRRPPQLAGRRRTGDPRRARPMAARHACPQLLDILSLEAAKQLGK